MRKILLPMLCLACLLSYAHADIYSDLDLGVVSVIAQDIIPFRAEPDDRVEPQLNIGPGVSLTLLSIDKENNWAYVELEHGGSEYPVRDYVRPGALMNGDYLYDAAGTHATEQRETYKALVTTPLREPIGVIMIDAMTGVIYGVEVIPYEDFESLYSK